VREGGCRVLSRSGRSTRPGWVEAACGAGDGGACVGRVRGWTTVAGMTKPQVIHLVTWGFAGALGGIRTPNLLIRSQMLYPLSYERRTTKGNDTRGMGVGANRLPGRRRYGVPRLTSPPYGG
jgi:hypothetical protein